MSWGGAGTECRTGDSRRHWDLKVIEGLSTTRRGPKPQVLRTRSGTALPDLRHWLIRVTVTVHELLTPAYTFRHVPSTVTALRSHRTHSQALSCSLAIHSQPDPVYKTGPKPTL